MTAEAVDERVHVLFFREGGETDTNLQFVRDMLTKKAFDREAVLRTYGRVRRGDQVPDQELDLVTSWLKLSGVVCRREGWLRVRNAIYEEVFDERWVRDHLRLNVNWRRRLARLAAGLVLLWSLVTIPLAIYAWRQKTEAEYQALAAQTRARRGHTAAALSTELRLAEHDRGFRAPEEHVGRAEAVQPGLGGGHRGNGGERRSRTSKRASPS